MNKVLNINLGGYPFTIDDDAYAHLEKYLDTIHYHFQKSDGYEEITSDIEARMAELFQEQMGTRAIVTIRDVEACISIMGTPEEFGAEPLLEDEQEEFYERAESHSTDSKREYKTGRKLFRDPEDEIVGGVCSGIASYFGVEDPVWVRLLFVVAFLTGTIGLWVYIILWAILPEAKSAGDRLAMKGEPINVSNIGKIIEEEFDNLSDKLDGFGNDVTEKFDDFGNEMENKFKSKKKVLAKGKNKKAVEQIPLRNGYLL